MQCTKHTLRSSIDDRTEHMAHDMYVPASTRLKTFDAWLCEHGAEFPDLLLTHIPDHGLGARAKAGLAARLPFIRLPRVFLLTAERARSVFRGV